MSDATPFRLVRYVTLASLAFFLAAGAALAHLYRQSAIDALVRVQEAGNVSLAQVFANILWAPHFLPLLQETARVAAPNPGTDSRIPEIHRQVVELMRDSHAYKVKVYDPRGRTVYSSEMSQIGEDKSGNPGFRGALAGETRSELVHKDRFSAFELEVENRDLIQSYVPRYGPDGRTVAGVFEIYSDVTPFLAEIHTAEKRLGVGVAAAFGLLYLALLLIVRRADRVIADQGREREHAQQQLAHAEKMASLGQLVAGIAHQLNTPLALSHSNVSLAIEAVGRMSLPLKLAGRMAEAVRQADGAAPICLDPGKSRKTIASLVCSHQDSATVALMLADVREGLGQMRELVNNLLDFTRLDRARIADADLNAALHTVVYIARSAIPPRVRIVEDFGPLPFVECNPSQLNQAFLNLITNGAQAIPGEGSITVRSRREGDGVRIDVIDTGTGIPAHVLPHIFDSYFTTKPKGVGTGLGLSIARDIVAAHGGDLQVAATGCGGTTFTVALPLAAGNALH